MKTNATRLYTELIEKSIEVNVACQTKPEYFYPEDFLGTNLRHNDYYRFIVKVAKSYCTACPLQELCLEYALEAEEEFGIWGGLTARER